MTDPDGSYALQAAIVARLVADARLTALVAGRVYDRAPQNVVFPWVEIGEWQDLPWEDGGCINGLEYWLTIHVWARSHTAASEAKAVNAAIKASLHNQKFPLVGHTLQSMRVPSARVIKDPDVSTRHGIVSVNAFTTAN